MKIINIHKVINADELLSVLQQKLNPLFQQQKQSNINFTIENKEGCAEISQPQFYEGFLFRIEIKGEELLITRSEHYVDDVNSLTLESILYGLFDDIAGETGTTSVLEG